jgi:hypothetical protein
VVDENEVVLQATYIRAVLCLWGVDKVWICEMADKCRYLWSHAVLGFELGVRISFQYQPLEETPIKIEAVAFLNSEIVAINLWTELSIGMVSTILRAHDEMMMLILVISNQNDLFYIVG